MASYHTIRCREIKEALVPVLRRFGFNSYWIKREYKPNKHEGISHFVPQLDVAIVKPKPTEKPENHVSTDQRQKERKERDTQYNNILNEMDCIIESWLEHFRRTVKIYAREKHWKTIPPVPSSTDTFVKFEPRAFAGKAKCCITIEYENSLGNSKSKIGSILNASIMGKLGLIVARDNDILDQLTSLWQYLYHSECVRGKGRAPRNIIIVTKEQFENGIKKLEQ